MDIQITTKKSEGVERLLEVSIPLATVSAEEDKQARRYATTVRLPGFRPGKAPAAMVKKRFKDAIRQQVLETLVQEAFKEVMEREKLDVAAQPHVHDVKFDDGQPLTFELHLEVRPTIELKAFASRAARRRSRMRRWPSRSRSCGMTRRRGRRWTTSRVRATW
jgi:trigger factor